MKLLLAIALFSISQTANAFDILDGTYSCNEANGAYSYTTVNNGKDEKGIFVEFGGIKYYLNAKADVQYENSSIQYTSGSHDIVLSNGEKLSLLYLNGEITKDNSTHTMDLTIIVRDDLLSMRDHSNTNNNMDCQLVK